MAAPGLDEVRAALDAHRPARVADAVKSRAAVAIVLRDGAAGLDVLFIRRAEHPRDPWSGQMAFPGGRFEPQDGDLKDTAIRETAEEIALDLGKAEYLGALDEVRAMARLRPMDLTILPFVFYVHDHAGIVPGDEVKSVHWLPLASLLSAESRASFEYRHDGKVTSFPSLELQGLVIWGLTYRMLLGFTALVTEPQADAPRP
jgi:8-oxo-dGTP pyrophosphatase MutT (NUDIX family)